MEVCSHCEGKTCEDLTQLVGRVESHEGEVPYMTVRLLKTETCRRIKDIHDTLLRKRQDRKSSESAD